MAFGLFKQKAPKEVHPKHILACVMTNKIRFDASNSYLISELANLASSELRKKDPKYDELWRQTTDPKLNIGAATLDSMAEAPVCFKQFIKSKGIQIKESDTYFYHNGKSMLKDNNVVFEHATYFYFVL